MPGIVCFDCDGAKREPTFGDAVLAAGLHKDLSECENVQAVENLNEVKIEGEASE